MPTQARRARSQRNEALAPEDGSMAEVSIESSTVRNARVHRCILGTFRRWTFPTAGDETPFVLSAR